MRLSVLAVLLCLAPLVSTAGELPFLKPAVPYSGTRIISTPDGEFSQRVYWTPDKVRTETQMPGMSMTNIVREDLGLMWILSPDGQVCLEQTLTEVDDMALAPGTEAYGTEDVDFKEIGEETVDGLATTKYEVMSTEESGVGKALFWVTADNIPVRMEIESAPSAGPYRVVIRLTDLSTAPLADELFETGIECRPMPQMPSKSPGAPSQ